MKNPAKSKKNRFLAIGILSTAFALTAITGCEASFSVTYGNVDKDVTLGTNPYQHSDDVITPYSVTEGYNEYGYPFTSYKYRGADIDEGLTCRFNNSSSKNVELIVDGYVEDVDFKVNNARLVTDYIGGRSEVDITVPANSNGSVIYPYDYVPVFECDSYENLKVYATAGTTVRLGNSYQIAR